MKIKAIFAAALMAVAAINMTSCTEKKFRVEGTIKGANDSTLYLENMSLNGPVAVDSVKLSEDGKFSFAEKASEAPEFYRLRIAGQIINVAVDSTETIGITAEYPGMASNYVVTGSEECMKIKELATMQMGLQAKVNAIAQSAYLGIDAVADSIDRVVESYKNTVKYHYIFKEPMKAYSYFALFQTISLGNASSLIFNPRNSEEDVKVFAAVATSWDTYWPKAERGENLHNIAIEGLKTLRIQQQRAMGPAIDASQIEVTNLIDVPLTDNQGKRRSLRELVGKVVLLDFHAFSSQGSMQRIMLLRDLYNKYHERGLEIYQVSVDDNEHFWKTQTAALPWICVRDVDGSQSQYLTRYNVQQVPTFFLIDKTNALYKRDTQIKNLDDEIEGLL